MGALIDGIYQLHLGSRFTETLHAHYKLLKMRNSHYCVCQ